MTRPWFVAAALAASAALLPFTVGAQAPSDDAPPPYRPSLADLMSTTVQPRHIKLAFAGREKNWAFAAYELKQLGDAFDRLSVQWPQWRKQPIVELVETMIRDPLFELDIAVKNQNMAQYLVGLCAFDRGLQRLPSGRAAGSGGHRGPQGNEFSGPGLPAEGAVTRRPATSREVGWGNRPH